jgi:hypothetical protein
LIAELEQGLARRRVGVLPPVAAIALAAALFLMWWMRADVAYFISPRQPIELGAEGEYHFERALPNRYAQVHGIPAVRGWYALEKDGDFVLLGLTDTPLVVRRVTFADEQLTGDGKRPQPRQNPFSARGRLTEADGASRYAEAITQYQQWSGVKVKWLLIAEQPPGRDLGAMAMFGFLALFASVNAWFLVRGLRSR